MNCQRELTKEQIYIEIGLHIRGIINWNFQEIINDEISFIVAQSKGKKISVHMFI